MSLLAAMAEKKVVITEKWLDAVLATYDKDGADFFKKQKDQFANPLGYNAEIGLKKVVAGLISGDKIELPAELIQFVKLRAVQKFSASESIAFIYEIKKVIVQVCGQQTVAGDFAEWVKVGERIDRLALQVFDLYAANRELVYNVTLQEYKSGNAIMARGGCPSGTVMKKQNEEKAELKVIRDT